MTWHRAVKNMKAGKRRPEQQKQPEDLTREPNNLTSFLLKCFFESKKATNSGPQPTNPRSLLLQSRTTSRGPSHKTHWNKPTDLPHRLACRSCALKELLFRCFASLATERKRPSWRTCGLRRLSGKRVDSGGKWVKMLFFPKHRVSLDLLSFEFCFCRVSLEFVLSLIAWP